MARLVTLGLGLGYTSWVLFLWLVSVPNGPNMAVTILWTNHFGENLLEVVGMVAAIVCLLCFILLEFIVLFHGLAEKNVVERESNQAFRLLKGG